MQRQSLPTFTLLYRVLLGDKAEEEPRQSATLGMGGREATLVKWRNALVRINGESSAADDALSIEREHLDWVLWRSHVRDLLVCRRRA